MSFPRIDVDGALEVSLVAERPGGVDDAPVGRARDAVVRPPRVPVGDRDLRRRRHEDHQGEAERPHSTVCPSLLI